MTVKPKISNVDDYIAAAAPRARTALRKTRAIVKTVAPAAQEIISYRIPAYRQGRIFVYFAAFKSHIGMYPPVKGSTALTQALRPYRGEKGNLRFSLDQPMPYALIKRVVLALMRQYAK